MTVRIQDRQRERKRTARREAINGCSLSRSRGGQNDEEPLGEVEVVACPHSPLLRVLASICGRNEPLQSVPLIKPLNLGRDLSSFQVGSFLS